jgi:hypothetical protein
VHIRMANGNIDQSQGNKCSKDVEKFAVDVVSSLCSPASKQ